MSVLQAIDDVTDFGESIADASEDVLTDVATSGSKTHGASPTSTGN